MEKEVKEFLQQNSSLSGLWTDVLASAFAFVQKRYALTGRVLDDEDLTEEEKKEHGVLLVAFENAKSRLRAKAEESGCSIPDFLAHEVVEPNGNTS